MGQNWQQPPGKGWSGPVLLRLICQQFAGSANTQCWALVGRAASCFRRDLVNGVREGAEHQSWLPLVYPCAQRTPSSPTLGWSASSSGSLVIILPSSSCLAMPSFCLMCPFACFPCRAQNGMPPIWKICRTEGE